MKTVLVVDDEFDLTGTLRAILRGAGYRAETCADGKEALDCLGSVKPDLVLMDVMMPRVSGLEVLKRMRQTPEWADVPVVLMSVMPPAVKRSDYGWQAFLRKPFTLKELVKTVKELAGEPDQAKT
jgi:CheY-like chemotaxis protein